MSSGKVSTLMRGNTTAAKTTTAMEIMRMAMGFLRNKRVIPAFPPRGGSMTSHPGEAVLFECISRGTMA